jgi:hypothetical protein
MRTTLLDLVDIMVDGRSSSSMALVPLSLSPAASPPLPACLPAGRAGGRSHDVVEFLARSKDPTGRFSIFGAKKASRQNEHHTQQARRRTTTTTTTTTKYDNDGFRTTTTKYDTTAAFTNNDTQ